MLLSTSCSTRTKRPFFGEVDVPCTHFSLAGLGLVMSGKERQEQEAAGLRETLQEQRAHIDVLDSALSNAQSTVLRLEEEVRQKEVYVDRVKSMTKSLEQLQVASEKREGMEKKLRQKLEEELEQLRREREGERMEEGVDIQQLARQMAEQE